MRKAAWICGQKEQKKFIVGKDLWWFLHLTCCFSDAIIKHSMERFQGKESIDRNEV